MKLSTKLFLGISGVMAAAVLIFGYFILSVDFKKNLDYQIDNGIKEFQSSALLISQSYGTLTANLDQQSAIILAAQYADRSNHEHINLYKDTGEPVLQGISYAIPGEYLDGASANQYKSFTTDGRTIVVFTGIIDTGDQKFILQTAKDVTGVYENFESMRNRFITILAVSLALTIVIAYVFS